MIEELKTDYKDDVLATSQQGKRTFNIVGKNGEILFEDVHIEDSSRYIQVGDEYGGDVINETNGYVNQMDDKLDELIEFMDNGVKAEDVTYNDSNVKLALDTLITRDVTSITRSGTTFTAKNSNGDTLFTFTQQDNNTTTGTSYNAGSCPDNTTFGTNGSIKRVNDRLTKRTNYTWDEYTINIGTIAAGGEIIERTVTIKNATRDNKTGLGIVAWHLYGDFYTHCVLSWLTFQGPKNGAWTCKYTIHNMASSATANLQLTISVLTMNE